MKSFWSSLRQVSIWMLVILVIYIAGGIYSRDNLGYRASQRAIAVSQTGSEIEIGVIWSGDPEQSFQTAVEAALEVVNQKGIIFPDGSSHTLKAVYVDANDCLDSDSFGRRYKALLDSDQHIASVLVKVPPNIASKAAVVSDNYGVALILSTRNDPSQSVRNCAYQLCIGPPQRQLVNRVNSMLESILPPGEGPLFVGVYFDAQVYDIDVSLRGYQQDLEQRSTLTMATSRVRDAIAKGQLDPKMPLGELDFNHYLQTGLGENPSEIATLLRHGLGLQTAPEKLSLQDALKIIGPNRRQLKLGFVRPFQPNQESYGPSVVFTQTAKADVVVLLTLLPTARSLIREFRQIQPKVPIICFDLQTRDYIRTELRGASDEFYTSTVLDSTSTEPAYSDFRQRFSARAVAAGRPVSEADDKALMGYQSVLLLSEALRTAGLTTPLRLINSIKYATKPWPVMDETFVFDSYGSPKNRETYLLKYTSDGFQVVRPR